MIRALRNVSFVLLGSLLLSIPIASFSQKNQFTCLAKAMKPNDKDQSKKPSTKISQKSNSDQPTIETKEVELEDKDGKKKKIKAKIKRSSSDEGEVEMEGVGKFNVKGKKMTAPDGTVFDFGPPRREGNKVIFPDGREMEIKDSPSTPPIKRSPTSNGQSGGSPQKIAATTMPDLNKKSISPHVESPTSTSQNSYPYSVLYFPPGTPECDDDPFF